MINKLILVVEDEPSILQNITTILQLNQFVCEKAVNGLQALQWLANTQQLPLLIISDVMMPELNGFQFLQQVKANNITQNIPFCFLTARADIADVEYGKSLGANAYITKPFTAKILLDTVHTLLGLH